MLMPPFFPVPAAVTGNHNQGSVRWFMPTINRRAAAGIGTIAVLVFLCWFAIGCGGGDDEPNNEPNVEATIAAVVAEISATQEAEVQAEAPTPTSSPPPSPTPKPTATVAPTPTEASNLGPSPTIDPATWVAPLTPLPISDPAWLLANLSEAERVCLAQRVPAERFAVLVESPELATAEERQTLLGCLEQDTKLRLFLTPVLTATGPLSDASSACLRSGFADTDLGAILLAASGEPGANPDAEAAMAMAMVSFMVSLSCLNEDEFQTASPTMGIAPEEYENFQCVLEAVGGPEEMAALMRSDAGFPAPLFEAAITCGAQVSEPPVGQ